MKSNLFDMLIDLIGNFLKNEIVNPDIETLMNSLSDAGVDQATIHRMFDKLVDEEEPAQQVVEPVLLAAPKEHSARHFSLQEKQKIASDAREYLFQIKQNGFIDAKQREMIIEYAMDVDVSVVDLHVMKAIAVAVVIKHSEVREAVWMEFLLYPERYRAAIHH